MCVCVYVCMCAQGRGEGRGVCGEQRWLHNDLLHALLSPTTLQGLRECSSSSSTCQLLDTGSTPSVPFTLNFLSAPAFHPFSPLESPFPPPALAVWRMWSQGNLLPVYMSVNTSSSQGVGTSCPWLTSSPSAGWGFTLLSFQKQPSFPGPPD